MTMDPRVLRLASPEDCAAFARNAIDCGYPDLAAQARQRAVQLRAANASSYRPVVLSGSRKSMLLSESSVAKQ